MNLKEQIAEFLVKNRIEQALKLLQSQFNLTIHLQNDITILQRNHEDILYQEQQAFLTYEQVNVEKNKLSRTILQLTDNILAGKPPLTLSNFTEQVPSRNLLLILLVLEIAIGILGELFPENIKTSINDALGSAYPIVYFTVIGFTIFAFLWFSLRKEKPKTTLISIDSFLKEEVKIRQALIERYHSRIKQKTDFRLPVTLTLTYTKEGSSPNYLHFSKDIVETQKIEGNLLETLKKHNHLLILGDPGAGKTTQILELAIDWLEKNEGLKIPVVFNLASWKNDGQRFDEWLQEALVSGYGFSKQLAKEAIYKSKILPLLDGLDEVARDLVKEEERNEIRSSCLRSIDQYLSLFEVSYLVICSRRVEYIAAAADAPIKAAVLVNPLKSEEIKDTLNKAFNQITSTKDENAATSLLKLLPQHPHLEIVLRSPFYYNIALEVFDERSTRQNLPMEQEVLQQYLLTHFLNEKLTQTPNLKGFAALKTSYYLAWLAHLLNIESKVNFELVSFQPYHLDKQWKGNWGLGVISGLFFVIFFSLFFGLIRGLDFGLMGGLYIGVFGRFEIKPSEKRNINWIQLLHIAVWKNVLAFGLIFGFTFGSIGGVVFGFNSVLTGTLIGGLALTLHFGLIYGFVFGLIGGMFFGLVKGLVENASFATIASPYHRLKSEIKFEILQWITIILPTNLLVSYISGTMQTWMDLTFGVLIAVVFGIFLGLLNTSFFKHLILRLFLYGEKKLPLRWVSFFNYATAARILEQDGGQWRFRHQILQDYFAKKWEEQQAISKSAH